MPMDPKELKTGQEKHDSTVEAKESAESNARVMREFQARQAAWKRQQALEVERMRAQERDAAARAQDARENPRKYSLMPLPLPAWTAGKPPLPPISPQIIQNEEPEAAGTSEAKDKATTPRRSATFTVKAAAISLPTAEAYPQLPAIRGEAPKKRTEDRHPTNTRLAFTATGRDHEQRAIVLSDDMSAGAAAAAPAGSFAGRLAPPTRLAPIVRPSAAHQTTPRRPSTPVITLQSPPPHNTGGR